MDLIGVLAAHHVDYVVIGQEKAAVDLQDIADLTEP